MKKVLITGGSRGIGRACVEKFTSEGFTVCFIYNNSDKNAREISSLTGALAVKADIGDPRQACEACTEAIEKMGGIDILINNAGVSHIGLFTDMNDTEYRKIMSVNADGAFFASREAARYMVRQHFGRIVNIGSMWGKTGASCEVAYSASKAAIEGLTKALAKELGLSGICVNCIEPGVVNTEMNTELDEDSLSELCSETPVGRIASPSEVAEFVYLIATEKSGFLTGQIIGFDGGFAI